MTIPRSARQLVAGETLSIPEGRCDQPIVMTGLSGRRDRPITLRGAAPDYLDETSARRSASVLGTDQCFEGFNPRANDLSRVQEAGGGFPGVYYVADNAQLVLRDCQWIVIEDLTFENCWPTAIYIENCQHITIRGVHFRGGTFAIGATGFDTRHLLIENCDWIQDPSCHGDLQIRSIRENGNLEDRDDFEGCKLWRKTNWLRIHGIHDETERYVEAEDSRAYDGDFFRAWTIAGYVILRNNCIFDAFNGIHFYNQVAPDAQDRFSKNVMISDNWFVRIRDNAVEPEDYAFNWTIRHNKFVDCYATYSFEPDRSGYFYVYGNLGWNRARPGPDDDDRDTGRLFKLATKHEALGPHYVVHNTWYARNPIFKKKRLADLNHLNNVIGYDENAASFSFERVNPFGAQWHTQHDPTQDWATIKALEKGRFTKAWDELKITIDNDMVGHPSFPLELRAAGYALGTRASGVVPEFADPDHGRPEGLEVTNAIAAAHVEFKLPDGQTVENFPKDCAPLKVGAWQETGLFKLPDPPFVKYWEEPHPAGGETPEPEPEAIPVA